MSADLSNELTAYGALPSQLVDVSRDDQWRLLSYLDLRAGSSGWHPPIVVESAGRPCVHVFDSREGAPSEERVARWCWRIALRGDGGWVGVLEPGVLRIYRADFVDDQVRPLKVDSAKPGEWLLPKFLSDVSAGQGDVARRLYLRRLLDQSAQAAVACGLSQADALSLVGRGLFWRFLVDRKLLDGLEPREVCRTARTWEQCLDETSRAEQTFRWLDATFNGGLLPFEAEVQDFAPEVFSSVLGNIAHGATETGQLRLPTDWQEVNFSYVPVGLLSEVYEAFAHNRDKSEAVRKSIHYTPAHLVDFIVAQALEQLPTGGSPSVLDPAAGAGVFLVTALRKLIERDWQETGKRPQRQRIREVLNQQLVGFDVDPRALRLAELALYLTALELDPDPEPLSELRFDELRNKVLFDLSDVEQGSLGPVGGDFRNRFDLVIGNPPWTAQAKGRSEKKMWVYHTRAMARERLGEMGAAKFDFPDTNMDLPFVWRALEWAKEGGRIALVTHARWLFGISPRAAQARNNLLTAVRVTGILNGSALRKTHVWPGVDAPWCVLFATNEPPLPFNRAAFQFVSPALDTWRESQQARVRIDWLDAQRVLASEVVDRPWMLKARFHGNRLAIRTLESMRRKGEELGNYLRRIGREFRSGYQVGGQAGNQVNASHMQGMPQTKGAGPLGFVVDEDALPKFDRKTLLRPRDPEIYRAPLLLVTESISANRLVARVSRVNADVAFHQSFHGLSLAGLEESEFVARYLQLWLQSNAAVFVALLMDGRYGIERDAIYKESLELIPVVPPEALSAVQRDRVTDLSNRLAEERSTDLADEIDTFVFDTFDLSPPEREAIRDTLDIALPSAAARQKAVATPRADERKRFVDTLRDSLASVLLASRLRTSVRERSDLRWNPWRVLEVCVSPDGGWSDVEPPAGMFLEEADAQGASLVIARASETTWFLGMLERYALWTPTRARLLAADLIAERSSR